MNAASQVHIFGLEQRIIPSNMNLHILVSIWVRMWHDKSIYSLIKLLLFTGGEACTDGTDGHLCVDNTICEDSECKLEGLFPPFQSWEQDFLSPTNPSLYLKGQERCIEPQNEPQISSLTAGQTGCSATVECVSTAECDAADSTCKAKGGWLSVWLESKRNNKSQRHVIKSGAIPFQLDRPVVTELTAQGT